METIQEHLSAAYAPLNNDFAVQNRRLMPLDESHGENAAADDDADGLADLPRRRRILIADDEAAIRTLITTFLTRAGYAVDYAVDGQEAIEKLQAHTYDAVVTDLMMPRVDGVGVVRYLQEKDPELLRRTIVLTAYPRLAESEAIEKLCAVVAKPFELVNLRGMLNAMFDAPAS